MWEHHGQFHQKTWLWYQSPVAEWFRWTLVADKRSLRLCPPVQSCCGLGNSFVVPMSKSRCEVKQVKTALGVVFVQGIFCGSVTEPSGVRSANLRIPYRPRKILTVCFDVVRGKGIYAKSTILWGFSGIWHQLFLLFGFARVGMVLNRWFYSSFRELVTSSWSVIPL